MIDLAEGRGWGVIKTDRRCLILTFSYSNDLALGRRVGCDGEGRQGMTKDRFRHDTNNNSINSYLYLRESLR